MTTHTPDTQPPMPSSNTQPPMPGSELFIHNIDSAPAYWWLDDLWIVLAEAKDTGGLLSSGASSNKPFCDGSHAAETP